MPNKAIPATTNRLAASRDTPGLAQNYGQHGKRDSKRYKNCFGQVLS